MKLRLDRCHQVGPPFVQEKLHLQLQNGTLVAKNRDVRKSSLKNAKLEPAPFSSAIEMDFFLYYQQRTGFSSLSGMRSPSTFLAGATEDTEMTALVVIMVQGRDKVLPGKLSGGGGGRRGDVDA